MKIPMSREKYTFDKKRVEKNCKEGMNPSDRKIFKKIIKILAKR